MKSGSPDEFERMMARMRAEESRPIDDDSPLQEFPKYGKPLVQVGSIDGKAYAWTKHYGLIEWLDASGKYHVGWAHASRIKRVKPEQWRGSSEL